MSGANAPLGGHSTCIGPGGLGGNGHGLPGGHGGGIISIVNQHEPSDLRLERPRTPGGTGFSPLFGGGAGSLVVVVVGGGEAAVAFGGVAAVDEDDDTAGGLDADDDATDAAAGPSAVVAGIGDRQASGVTETVTTNDAAQQRDIARA